MIATSSKVHLEVGQDGGPSAEELCWKFFLANVPCFFCMAVGFISEVENSVLTGI